MSKEKIEFFKASNLPTDKYQILIGGREIDTAHTSAMIMLKWLKSVLEVYETGGTYNQYNIRIKENFADPQGALKVIKEWLDDKY